MGKIYKRTLFILLIMIGLFLSSCGNIDETRRDYEMKVAETIYADLTMNPRYTLTATATSTTTPTPTSTPTATPTPLPSSLDLGLCNSNKIPPSTGVPFNWEWKECVDSVELLWDGKIKLIFAVSATRLEPGAMSEHQCIVKGSDYLNKNMYLMDNLGNRYDHFDVDQKIKVGIICEGTESNTIHDYFLFEPINPNATELTFFDDDQNFVFGPFEIDWK